MINNGKSATDDRFYLFIYLFFSDLQRKSRSHPLLFGDSYLWYLIADVFTTNKTIWKQYEHSYDINQQRR